MKILADIEDFLELEPAPDRVGDLDTPMLVVDLGIVTNNVARWQDRCDRSRFHSRPHIKTHKSVGVARYQVAVGSIGITVQKLGEAEVMAAAGLKNQLLAYNIVGRQKLERLAALNGRIDISVVADNSPVVEGLSWVGASSGRELPVLVECDTGGRRNGVQSPAEAAGLARLIDRTPGVRFAGLMAFEHAGDRAHMREFIAGARDLIGRSGIGCGTISFGGSPDMWSDEGLDVATEYRAGTYIYNDREQVNLGACSMTDCAARILTTVVSVPGSGERAVLDAGSKALTSDLVGLTGYGIDCKSGRAIYALSEEHGLLDIRDLEQPPQVGDRLMLLPNHICPVVNLHDRMAVVRGTRVVGMCRIDARGLSR